MMKAVIKFFGFLVCFGAFILFIKTNVLAVSFSYTNYDVDITINEDSSFRVLEKATYAFYGEAHGLRRDITLTDPARDRYCTNSTDISCGGFEKLIFNGVYDKNGDEISGINYYDVYDENTGKTSTRIEWEVWPEGKYLNGDEITWQIDYTVLGGVKWFEELNQSVFYWNTLPEDRGGVTGSSVITIKFPDSTKINTQNFTLYDPTYVVNRTVDPLTNSIVITSKNLGAYSDFTVSYEFGENEIERPAILKYKILSPLIDNSVYLNGALLGKQTQDIIDYFPTGENVVTFEHVGYKSAKYNLNLSPGEVKELLVNLEPEPFMNILFILNWIIFIVGCLITPFALVLVIVLYRLRGRDKNMPKTIIPLFKPPVGIRPYLLGTLKDEIVDREDIIGTVIDLAYRGFIKIKEITKDKNYLLSKLGGKEGEKLFPNEQEILDAIFNGKDSVETKDLGKHFPQKYLKIVENIYKETVEREFFNRSPRTVRASYAAFGVFLTLIGICTTFSISIFITPLIGYTTVFTPGIAFLVGGMSLLVASKFMPAKTPLGSKTYADILGFKMYLHTAERFRLQKLGPDEFERYLSYAVVFKIENEWAKKFEGIYEGKPDWFEGTGSVYDAIWISSFTRSFSNSTVTNITPSYSGSATGGGWSGGGSFGGFSGGGGGGGSSGGW